MHVACTCSNTTSQLDSVHFLRHSQELACSPLRIHPQLATAEGSANSAGVGKPSECSSKVLSQPMSEIAQVQGMSALNERVLSVSSEESTETWIVTSLAGAIEKRSSSLAAAAAPGSCSPSSTISESPPLPNTQLDRQLPELPPLPPSRSPRSRRREQNPQHPFSVESKVDMHKESQANELVFSSTSVPSLCAPLVENERVLAHSIACTYASRVSLPCVQDEHACFTHTTALVRMWLAMASARF